MNPSYFLLIASIIYIQQNDSKNRNICTLCYISMLMHISKKQIKTPVELNIRMSSDKEYTDGLVVRLPFCMCARPQQSSRPSLTLHPDTEKISAVSWEGRMSHPYQKVGGPYDSPLPEGWGAVWVTHTRRTGDFIDLWGVLVIVFCT